MTTEHDDPLPHPLIGSDLGPYRIDRLIGRGGMGCVFAATVREKTGSLNPGDVVAVKTIDGPARIDSTTMARFEREGQLGLGIDHPNVVKTYEHGVRRVADSDSDVRIIVMEYVEGETLAQLMARLGFVPEELCRHVGREMARGLAAVHATGAVHRDVKPSNVLITPDHEVKLMDFGVARSDDGSPSISQTGSFVGTPAYAAPEQLLELEPTLDSRADAWAIGVSLYEMAAGVHPIAAETPMQLVQNVARPIPRRLGAVRPQISPFFEEIVHSLLVVEREERLGPAEKIAEILHDAERSSWWRTRRESLERRARRPIRRIRLPRETAVHGRDAELNTLRAAFERTIEGSGQFVLIEGEAGVGKTRLIDEFLSGIEARDEHVNALIGAYRSGGAATASGALIQAIVDHLGEDGLEEELRRHLAVTPTLVPAFAALLRGSPPPEDVQPLNKDTVTTVFVHALRSIASDRPTVLWIDDVHLAPEEGRGLLAALAMAVPEHRVLLLGSARPGLPSEWVSSMRRLSHVRRLDLGRLEVEHVERMLEDALDSPDLAEELAPRIAEKSDGNPFFLLEILKELRRQGVLHETATGEWRRAKTTATVDVDVPSSIQDLIDVRLSALDDRQRAMLDVASCIGFDFDPVLVGEVLQLPRIALLTGVAAIERRHRLVRSAGRTMLFDHHQVQETLYAGLSERARQQFHTAIGDAMERRTVPTANPADQVDGAHAVTLCDHFLRGDAGERAKPYLSTALSHLQGRCLTEAAVALSERSLASPGLLEGDERIEQLLAAATNLRALGRPDRAFALLEEARTLDGGLSDARPSNGAIERDFASTLVTVARYDEALEHFAVARAQAASVGDELALASLDAEHSLALFRAGHVDDGEAAMARALEAFERSGDRRKVAVALSSLGGMMLQTGRLDDARSRLESAIEIAQDIGDLRIEASATGNLGIVFSLRGRDDESMPRFERHLQLSREVGYRGGEAAACGNLGPTLFSAGEAAKARRRIRRAIEIARETADRQREAIGLLNLGAQLSQIGAIDEALGVLTDAVTVAREIGAKRALCYALERLAAHHGRHGDDAAARAPMEEAERIARAIREPDIHLTCLYGLSDLSARAGDQDLADQYRAEAEKIATRSTQPWDEVLAALKNALAGKDAQPARDALARHEEHLEVRQLFTANQSLFDATGDTDCLEAAYRHLSFLHERVGTEYETGFIENVPAHRRIVDAWERMRSER